MKILMLVGAMLVAIGLGGVIWGLVEMADDRDVIDLGGDSKIVLDDGDFPPFGIAGAITAGVGVLLVIGGGMAGRKP